MALALPLSITAAEAVDHGPWDQLLHRYVKAGLVDYSGVQSEQWILTGYLRTFAGTDPARLPSKQAQLAFWINAYNACVFAGVLDHYPLRSVKDVHGFFDKIHYEVGGESLTLNEIEQRGRALGDWRIHFAVVCASSSCPPLRSEAYVPDRLNDQLAEQTRNFLADSTRGLRVGSAVLWLSQLFKWYEADFLPGERSSLFRSLDATKLLAVLTPYLSPDTVDATRGRSLSVKFLHYDWTLNVQR